MNIKRQTAMTCKKYSVFKARIKSNNFFKVLF